MRAFLALGVGPMSMVLHERCRFANPAVLVNREDCDAPAGVVRHQHPFPTLVDDDVARIGAAGWDFVEEGQLAGCAIDRERAHSAAVGAFVISNFVHGIQKTPTRMQREERRIRRFRREPQRRALSGRGIEAIGVNTLALTAFLRVGADIEKILAVGRSRRGKGRYKRHN